MEASSLARRILGELLLVATSIAIGLAIGGIVALLYGAPPGDVLESLFTSYRLYPDMVVEYAAVLTLTGLAFAIPLHAGLFNIGGEGALYAGALTFLVVALHTGSLPLALLAAGAAGAALLALAGVLRVYLGVNEVLSTIMLNWVVYWILLYIVIVYLADPVNPQRTLRVPESARLPRLPLAGGVPSTIVFSAILAVASFAVLRMSRWGLLLRASGANPHASTERGVPVRAYQVASMAAAGLLAGLAGGIHIAGYSLSIDVLGGTVRNYGYTGIGVALAGRNDPLGILVAAFFFSLLAAGSQSVEPVYGIPKELADVVAGVIVVALAAPEAIRLLARKARVG